MPEARVPGMPRGLARRFAPLALLLACHGASEPEKAVDASSSEGSTLAGPAVGSAVDSSDALDSSHRTRTDAASGVEDGGSRLTVQVRVPASEGVTPLRPNRSPLRTCVHVVERPEPRTLESSLRGRCVVLVGYFAEEVAWVEERPSASDPERVRWRRYRPFRFVRQRNPSLGWPEWAALSAVLVDEGTADANEPPLPLAGRDLENVEVVVGRLRPWPRSAPKVWRVLLASRGESAGPYAQEELPLVLDDVRFVERAEH